MPTYTLPKAQRSAATRKWSSNYRGGVPSSFDAYIKTFTDFYSNDLITLGYNIIRMNQMSNPRANSLSNYYYYYGYPTPQWTTNSTWAMPRAGIQAPSPPLQGYYYPSWTPAYSGHQKAQKKPERDTHDNGAASAAVVAATSGPRNSKPQGSRSMPLLPKFGGIFTLDRHEEAVGEGGTGGTAVHWVLAFAFHEDQKISRIKFWRFDQDPTSLLLASDDDDDTTHQDHGAENRQTLEARFILQVKPRKSRRRFFANERAVRTHKCCSSCNKQLWTTGYFEWCRLMPE